ncbi:MAG: beta-phosphoglucomutase, partial [Lactococcus lactis]
ALPIGVGRPEDLGDEIVIVPDTSYYTLEFLKEVWLQKQK